MLRHKAQGRSTTSRTWLVLTAEQKTTPCPQEHRHGIPLHGKPKKCHGTTCNAAAIAVTRRECCMTRNAIARCGGRRKQHNTAMAMARSTATQWRCQRRHQATAAQVDCCFFFFFQKTNYVTGLFFFFNCYRFFPFPESLRFVGTTRLFRVSWHHHCPQWMKPVDCFEKVFLVRLKVRIGYT